MRNTTQEVLDIVKALPQLPDTMRVKLPVVCALYCRSPASVWRDVSSGRIPEPRRDGTKNTYWTVGSLRRHLAES